MATTPAMATRLEKAAIDNGFDQGLPSVGGWMAFSSTHARLGVWLSVSADGFPVAAFSRLDVADALVEHGAIAEVSLPDGAAAARVVTDVPALHRLLRRAYQLARSLPNELLHSFEQKAASLPRSTEAERLVVQRVGQDIFRAGLMDYWEGRCAITGLAVPELLRASHIKPWADCETDAERLDVFNGLLLAPHFDALFDQGYITVSDTGQVLVSREIDDDGRQRLGLERGLTVARLEERHRAYLTWHCERIFRGPERAGRGVGPPEDVGLPCFVYGVFKPGELAFHQLEALLEGPPQLARAPGHLMVRDGLPLLKSDEHGDASGYLLQFRKEVQRNAYVAIGDLEPRALYRWNKVQLHEPAVDAWLLEGIKPDRGSQDLEAPEWDSSSDPVFTDALQVVESCVKKDGGRRSWSTKTKFFDWPRFFRLQAAYLLLWTAYERFTALRYGAWRDPMDRARRLGRDPLFAAALADVAPQSREVFDSRRVGKPVRLSKDDPGAAVDYYYQVRSNLSHRGKGAFRDGDIVSESLAELLLIFRHVLAAARKAKSGQ